jgi:hypothetical protein
MRHSKMLAAAAVAAMALMAFAGAVAAAAVTFAYTGEANQGSLGAFEMGGLVVLVAVTVGVACSSARRLLKKTETDENRVADHADLAVRKDHISGPIKFLGGNCYVGSKRLQFPFIKNPIKDTIDASPNKQAHENSELTTRLAMAS